MGKYDSERGFPKAARCTGVSALTFDGKVLILHTAKYQALSFQAASGPALDNNFAIIALQAAKAALPASFQRVGDRVFDYGRERQKMPDAGPIPEGMYWINPGELEQNFWEQGGLFHDPDWHRRRSSWGDAWITIHPYPFTETYERGGFFIHGGADLGSIGCIDLATQMNSFVAALKENLGEAWVPRSVGPARDRRAHFACF